MFGVLKQYQPTIFYGVPTLYAALLADPARPKRKELNLRVCTSAGEALPAEIGKRWNADYGCEILDGIGSTEMLHIFLSNRPGEVRYGTTGKPVPGYERAHRRRRRPARAATGEIGELQISGPSAALMYWNNRSKTKATFCGEWTRSGDKYTRDADGYYTYGGRSDDMLKVGGIYVSPFEVEAALMTHPAVLEAAVIGVADSDQLVKPKAYVVLKSGTAGRCGRTAAAREGPARAVQVPALGRVRDRAAQDRDRQDPAVQAAAVGPVTKNKAAAGAASLP